MVGGGYTILGIISVSGQQRATLMRFRKLGSWHIEDRHHALSWPPRGRTIVENSSHRFCRSSSIVVFDSNLPDDDIPLTTLCTCDRWASIRQYHCTLITWIHQLAGQSARPVSGAKRIPPSRERFSTGSTRTPSVRYGTGISRGRSAIRCDTSTGHKINKDINRETRLRYVYAIVVLTLVEWSGSNPKIQQQ